MKESVEQRLISEGELVASDAEGGWICSAAELAARREKEEQADEIYMAEAEKFRQSSTPGQYGKQLSPGKLFGCQGWDGGMGSYKIEKLGSTCPINTSRRVEVDKGVWIVPC
jgi:hypothetical protein